MKDTKSIILDKSLELFANRNYDAVSMNELCEATGLTKGAIYHYFKSKTEVYTASIDYYVEKILDELNCHNEPIGYADFINKGMSFYKAHHSQEMQTSNISFPMKCVFMLYGAHRFYPDFEKIGKKVYQAHINLWTNVLSYSVTTGEISGDIDVVNMARICQSISAGIFSKALLKYSHEKIHEDLESQYMALYDLMKKEG